MKWVLPSKIVFGMKNAEGIFSLSPREERVGREPERGENTKNGLLSPAPLLFFWEERENGSAAAPQANHLPNSMGLYP